ncbi:MAG: tetratricopeptide repeat protein, partial [Proteobacteria bacterium]|nr:tetratricopeptide repeat protein [Pseudomonadota bacterium]
GEVSGPAAARAAGRGARKPSTPDLEEQIGQAVALFNRGDYARCNALLQDCGPEGARDPRVRAFLAASRSMVNGRVREGVVACIEAIRGAFYIPDLYCALGVLLLRVGDRAKAYAAFQRGLRLDPRHRGIKAKLHEMGERRGPVLAFLDRANPANRVLGRVRAQLLRPDASSGTRHRLLVGLGPAPLGVGPRSPSLEPRCPCLLSEQRFWPRSSPFRRSRRTSLSTPAPSTP